MRRCWCLSIFLLLFVGMTALAGEVRQHRIQLEQQVKDLSVNDPARLPKLYELAKLAGGHNWKYYPSLLLAESRSRRNSHYEMLSLYLLVSYGFYNKDDSIYNWNHQLEPMLLKAKDYQKYYTVKAYLILRLGELGKIKIARDSLQALYDLSAKLNYTEGKDIVEWVESATEISEGKADAGSARMEKALALMRKHKDSQQARISVLRYICLAHSSLSKRFVYIKQLSEAVEKVKKQKKTEIDPVTPVYLITYLVDRNYAILYMSMKDLEQTLYYIRRAEKDIEDYDLPYRENEISEIYMNYYMAKGNHEMVLNMLDSLIQVNRKMQNYYDVASFYQIKGNTLMKLNRNREAQEAFSSYYEISDSLRLEDYRKTLSKLYADNHLNKLQLTNREMKISALHANERMRVMWVILSTILILIMVGIYLFISHLHITKKLKKERQKAEEADRLESAFLANMSYEIRTPLNAIVGFSQLIMEETDQSRKAQYSDIIQNSNEQLQRIISDVLDISKIESNTIQLYLIDLDMPALMHEIYIAFQSAVPDGIQLHLDDCAPCHLKTDGVRLKQIISYLILITIEKLKKGYICFGYEMLKPASISFYVQVDQKIYDGFSLNNQPIIPVLSFNGIEEENLKFTMARGLIVKMNGHIEIESGSKGTRFRVVFPKG